MIQIYQMSDSPLYLLFKFFKMPCSYVQLILACLCVLCSIAIYNYFELCRDPRTDSYHRDCELVKSIESRLANEANISSVFLCDYLNTGLSDLGVCPCPERESARGCVYGTVCILWKVNPNSDSLKTSVEAISEDFKPITSNKENVKGAITHFFISLSDGQPLHFANWFLQDDGSWWFDELPSDLKPVTAVGDEFYIGKFEGWMPRFSVRPAAGPSEPTDWSAFRHRLVTSRFVACDQERSHQFHLAEGRDVSADAERFRHRAWRLLAAAADALDQLGVPFWLSSGTCLGYYRQCDFVPYMGDVDVGVWISSVREWAGNSSLPSLQQLVAAMAARRLRLVHWFGLPSDGLELSFRSPDDIKLDIFFFYDDGDVVWNGGTQARTGKKFRYEFAPFELCWTVFRELRVRVPCDTERYLVANYGPDWRRPQPAWDWKTSPPNVRPNGVWSAEQLPLAVQLLEP